MSLNIKDEKTHRLVKELAKETGESQTTAVNTAVSERLERVRKLGTTEAKLAAIHAITARIAALDNGPYIDHAELLYDENGLPK
jgi:antitoxin VapB